MPNPPGSHGADDDHPFLTPNGLRLQRMGREPDTPVPHEHPPPSATEDGGRATSPAEIDPFEFEELDQAPIVNLRPSAKFPDPAVLARMPLHSHFRSRRVKHPTATVLKAIGKLFIQISSDPRHELAVGSAWITGPNTIATAAHNLFDSNTRTWSKAVEFHPGYDFYSDQPLPTCRVVSCLIPKDYFRNPTTNRDIATCFVDHKIGDLVGAEIPLRTIVESDFFEHQPIAIVGYPSGSGFDFGKQMWRSVGDYLFGSANAPGDDYAPVIATDFGGGASGCPWITKDPDTDEIRAVGVTSGHAKLRYVRGEPNLASLTSPYFGPRMFEALNDNAVFHDFG